ncbi:MAG: hypothetical protein JWN31_1170, partial [Frankiales bacterium]|nr:hypothetical protein [Frankiales bacterium]
MPFPRLALRALVAALVLLIGVASAPARAADYPLPTHGKGKVDRTRVPVGECVIFSGDPGGFQPGATLTIKDDGAVVGTAKADAQGEFSTKVCFATDAHLGRHVLTAEGIGANTAFRDVTATVTVVGASTTRPPPGGTTGGGTTTTTTTGGGNGGHGTGGQGAGTGGANGTGGNGTGGQGTGGSTGTGTSTGNGQPPGSVGNTTGGDGSTTGGPVAGEPGLGNSNGISNLALYGGLLGLLVL